MSNRFVRFSLVVFCLLFSYGFSSQNSNIDSNYEYDCFGRKLVDLSDECNEERLYLSPGMLHMESGNLYIIFENIMIPVPAVFNDEQGIYITNRKWGIWYCENGHPNPPWKFVCAVCGKT